MRCSCRMCGTYMVHHERKNFECICPQCRNTCRLCMGEGFGKPEIYKTKDGKMNIPDEILKRLNDYEKEKK